MREKRLLAAISLGSRRAVVRCVDALSGAERDAVHVTGCDFRLTFITKTFRINYLSANPSDLGSPRQLFTTPTCSPSQSAYEPQVVSWFAYYHPVINNPMPP